MTYLEEAQVEIVTVDYFRELGYEYVHGPQNASGRHLKNTVLTGRENPRDDRLLSSTPDPPEIVIRIGSYRSGSGFFRRCRFRTGWSVSSVARRRRM